jgi:hypothetical protein
LDIARCLYFSFRILYLLSPKRIEIGSTVVVVVVDRNGEYSFEEPWSFRIQANKECNGKDSSIVQG